MTMVPAQDCCKQHHLYGGGYGGGCGGGGGGIMSSSRIQGHEFYNSESSDLELVSHMAEDDSRTNSDLNEAASSSKNVHDHHQEEKDEDWLKLNLSIGSHETKHDRVELDLLPPTVSHQTTMAFAPIFHVPEFRHPPRPTPTMLGASSFSSSLFFHQNPAGISSNFPHHPEINWALRPLPRNISTGSSFSSSSSSSLMPFGTSFGRPFGVLNTGLNMAAGPSSEVRVIDPPRRPNSGIWFMLQASQNQGKEPFLPQIPKNYLRIKDGRMTVRLIMKYLVNKLRLDSDSEIEIRCRGQQLVPFLTLQHVRDNIWSSRDAITLLTDSSTPSDHVMVLQYGRSA